MKILHVTNAYPYIQNHSYGIFIKEQIDSLKNNSKNEIFFLNAQLNGNWVYLKQIPKLYHVIKEFNPNIIHCHHEFSIIPLIFIYPFIRSKIILSVLGDISKRAIINKIMYEISKFYSSRIIFKNTNYDGKIKNSIYLPNGVDIDLFKPLNKSLAKSKINLEGDYRYILFVTSALNNPIKRFDIFEEVLDIIIKQDSSIKPLIMHGTSRKETVFYYNAADLLLLTSEHEGSPNAIKEAMACNTPIVSTNVGNVEDLLRDSKNNYVCLSNKPKDLAALCLKALSKKTSNGRKIILDKSFDINSVANKLIKTYKEISI